MEAFLSLTLCVKNSKVLSGRDLLFRTLSSPDSACEMPSVTRTPHLFQTAHEVIADWRTRQVGGAGAPAHVEEVVGAQHGVVLLRVARGGQDAVHGDRHLHNKAQGKDTLYTQTKGSAKR